MSPVWQIILGVGGLVLITGVGGWLMFTWVRKSDEPGRLITQWVVSLILLVVLVLFIAPLLGQGGIGALVGLLAALVGGLGLALVWAPSITEYVGKKFGQLYDGGTVAIEPQAFYSIANAKRKRGQYHEAVAAVEAELARFPADFQGWMLRAEIEAEDLHDLEAATSSIERLIAQPGHSPKNVAFALTRLADWRLKHAQDARGAREAFERIVALFPDSPEAHLAHQRIAHVATPEVRAAMESRAPLTVPHSEERVGLRPDFTGLRAPVPDPNLKVGALVQQLEQFPLDNQAREELAVVYAEELHRLDLAAEQLEQLIAQPYAPASHTIRWLNLLADLQLQEGADVAAARATLLSLIERFPQTAAAETATRRLATITLEGQSKKESQSLRLGSYEQNIGLKMPRKAD